MAGNDNNGNLITTLLNGVRYLGQIAQTLSTTFPQTGGTTTTATGGAATLPANPVGFIVITLPDGTAAKVPYYS